VVTRRWVGTAAVALGLAVAAGAQPRAAINAAGEVAAVKRVIAARREYQIALEQLHTYYSTSGDGENLRWSEDELKTFHRVTKPAYIIDLDVAGPGVRPDQNVPAANDLYRRAMQFKDKGFGSDLTDNRIRAEVLRQQLLAQYPTSNKCPDAVYQLGDIYEAKKPPQHRRAAVYFERCVQWNATTSTDARLRAARIYDRHLNDKARAAEWYRAVLTHETDERRRQEAQRRLGDMNLAAER
jgi:TolA-binding protein